MIPGPVNVAYNGPMSEDSKVPKLPLIFACGCLFVAGALLMISVIASGSIRIWFALACAAFGLVGAVAVAQSLRKTSD